MSPTDSQLMEFAQWHGKLCKPIPMMLLSQNYCTQNFEYIG